MQKRNSTIIRRGLALHEGASLATANLVWQYASPLLPLPRSRALRRLAGGQPARRVRVHRAHALVVHDEFLVDAPDLHLPGQTAERGRGLGLDVLWQGNVRGAGVGCLADGGAEEEVS